MNINVKMSLQGNFLQSYFPADSWQRMIDGQQLHSKEPLALWVAIMDVKWILNLFVMQGTLILPKPIMSRLLCWCDLRTTKWTGPEKCSVCV